MRIHQMNQIGVLISLEKLDIMDSRMQGLNENKTL